MNVRRRVSRAFVLGEVLVVLVISGIVVAALLAGLIALVRSLQPQAVVVAGETLPVAPTFGAFPSAVRLHQVLSDRLQQARAVYVFGGRHVSIPATSAAATLRPLQLERLPDIADFSAGLPLDARAFYETHAAALGALDDSATGQDFTILVIGPANGALAPTCLVQVRRRDASLPDGNGSAPIVVREVRLWERDGTPLRYAHAEQPHQASAVFVGAVHTWLRFDPATGLGEEGPACVAFPDPWLYAGARGQADDLPPYSRFTYLLPVSS